MKQIIRRTAVSICSIILYLTFFILPTTAQALFEADIVLTSVENPWTHSKQRNIVYNGSHYILFYKHPNLGVGNDSIYAKVATTLQGLSVAPAQQLVKSHTYADRWDIDVVSDTKYDVSYYTYYTDAFTSVRTCDLAGTLFTCQNPAYVSGSAAAASQTSVRNPLSNRTWVASAHGPTLTIRSADQTGDSANITSWTKEFEQNLSLNDETLTIVSLEGEDSVMVLYSRNPNGTKNDGVYGRKITRGQGSSSVEYPVVKCSGCQELQYFGNAVRLADDDIRYIGVYPNGRRGTKLQEYQWDGTVWSLHSTLEATGEHAQPSIALDSYNDMLHVFYTNLETPAASIYRFTGDLTGTWGTKTRVDRNEADENSMSVTQMIQPPHGATRCPGKLVWAYRNYNAGFYDMIVGSEDLACN